MYLKLIFDTVGRLGAPSPAFGASLAHAGIDKTIARSCIRRRAHAVRCGDRGRWRGAGPSLGSRPSLGTELFLGTEPVPRLGAGSAPTRQTRPSLRALYRHSPTTQPLDERPGWAGSRAARRRSACAPVIGGLLRDRVELCIEGEVAAQWRRERRRKDAAVNAVGLAQRALRQSPAARQAHILPPVKWEMPVKTRPRAGRHYSINPPCPLNAPQMGCAPGGYVSRARVRVGHVYVSLSGTHEHVRVGHAHGHACVRLYSLLFTLLSPYTYDIFLPV